MMDVYILLEVRNDDDGRTSPVGIFTDKYKAVEAGEELRLEEYMILPRLLDDKNDRRYVIFHKDSEGADQKYYKQFWERWPFAE